MSNMNVPPQGQYPQGQNPQYGQYGPPQGQPRTPYNPYDPQFIPPQSQPPRNRGNGLAGLFAWVRSARIVRSRDRWVGGVCGGIAERLGWNPTLVRAIMVGAALVGGLGAAFYAFAWLLLPDRDTDEIYGEELVAGRFDWSMIGMLLLLALTIALPGVGLAAIVAALLGGFVLLQWSRREIEKGRWSGTTGTGPFGPMGPAGGTGPGAPATGASAGNGAPAGGTPGFAPPQPAPAAAPFTAAPQTPPVATPFMAAPASAPTAAPAAAAAAGPVAAPTRPRDKARPRVLRRKPAGFALVMIVIGLILISGAVASMRAFDSGITLTDQLRAMLIWSAAVCLALGAIVFVLGCMGRRSGGLIPVSLVAAVMVVVIGTYCLVFDYSTTSYSRQIQGMTAQSVGDYDTIVATPANMRRLQQGIAFEGVDDQRPWTLVGGNVQAVNGGVDNSSDLNIDMTHYSRDNGTHAVTLNGGGIRTSTCPVGTISIAARFVDVSIVLPDGCSYELRPDVSSYYDRDTEWTYTNQTTAGGATMSYDDATAATSRSYGKISMPWAFSMGLSPTFLDAHVHKTCTLQTSDSSASQYENAQCKVTADTYYDWALGRSSDPKDPELVIRVPAMMSANIGVEYKSTTTLPGYND